MSHDGQKTEEASRLKLKIKLSGTGAPTDKSSLFVIEGWERKPHEKSFCGGIININARERIKGCKIGNCAEGN